MDVSDQFVSNVFDPSFTGSGKHAAVRRLWGDSVMQEPQLNLIIKTQKATNI